MAWHAHDFILQNERRSIFQDLCNKVSNIWAELEEEPHGYFSTAHKDKSPPLVLSTAEMCNIEEAYKQVGAWIIIIMIVAINICFFPDVNIVCVLFIP